MLEIVAAALVPIVALLLLSRWRRFDDDFRRVVGRWFIPLALIFWSPCWLTARSPAPFDFLFARVSPWRTMAPQSLSPSFHSGNLLLSDVPMQFVPWRHVVVDAYRHGELPLLNRYAGSGSPLWENPQAAVLFPLTIAGIPFSGFAWPLFAAMCKTLIALTGMYLFLRAEEVGESAAVFGAIAYAFSTFGVAFALFPHTNVTVLLPWLMLAIARLHLTGAAIAVAVMLSGGHPESVLHCAMVAIPYGFKVILQRAPADRLPAFRTLAISAICGAMLAAPVVLPFALYVRLGERFARVASEPGLAAAPRPTLDNIEAFVLPAHFWVSRTTEPVDNFNEVATGYAGLASLALFLVAALTGAKRTRFWLPLFVVLLGLAFRFTVVTSVLSNLPLLGSVLHGRIRFALAFVLAVVAAHVLDSGASVRMTRAVAGSLSAIVLLVTFLQWGRHSIEGTSIVVLASATAAILATGLLAVPRLRAWMPLLLFADLAVVGMTYHAPVSRDLFYPTTPGLASVTSRLGPTRMLGLEGAFTPNTGAMVGLEDAGVHDPMSFEAYCSLLAAGGYDRREYFNRFHRLPPAVLLDFLGVSRIVTPPGALRTSMPVLYRGPDANVIANPRAMPRWFVPVAAVAGSLQSDPDARRVHLVDLENVRVSPATVVPERYGRNDEVIHVTAERETFLATSEVGLPGWRLQRNGQSWPLLEVNGVFLGWRVPAGESRFALSYVPRGLAAGVGSAVAGGLLLALLALSGRRTMARHASHPA